VDIVLRITENNVYILFIAVAAAVLILTAAMRLKAEWLLNFVMRSVLGAIAIYFINAALGKIGIASAVGINPLTVLTSGILGFPGLAALYGIEFCKFL
jgi:inhibitor of the pro-sigma K processing machinery